MADKKISALTASTTPLAGTEVLPIVQGGSTVKVAVSNLTAGRAVAMLSNTMAAATARNDVDRTGGAGYSYRMKGNDQDNVRFRVENTGGQIYEIVGGNPGASNDGLCILDVTNAAKRLYITSTGDITANTGNLVIGTAGKGIDFSANGGDVLTQYDEGTYTPVFTASSSNPTVTYGLQRGKYVRVGNTVTVSVFITWSAFSGGSGDLQISLPFAGESSVGAGGAGSISDLTGFTFAAGRTFCSVRPNSNVLYATFPQSGSLVSTSNTTVAQTAASGLIVFSTTYLI
jgi:hypothetical protein